MKNEMVMLAGDSEPIGPSLAEKYTTYTRPFPQTSGFRSCQSHTFQRSVQTSYVVHYASLQATSNGYRDWVTRGNSLSEERKMNHTLTLPQRIKFNWYTSLDQPVEANKGRLYGPNHGTGYNCLDLVRKR